MIVGDRLRARSEAGRRVEARIASDVLDGMTRLRRPDSVATGACVRKRSWRIRYPRIHAPMPRCKSEQVHDIFKNEMHGALMNHHRMVDDQVRA